MSTPIRELEPKKVWNNFEDLNAVPRASKKEEEVIAFMKKFATDRNLVVKEDSVGNVIVYKPASSGMENKKTVVLQSHLDMVHQKNNDTNFDFATEGIRSFIDQDWVTAEGTTLGADNGMGVAAIMTLLDSSDIAHPELVALFTIDEETGMTGAFGVDASLVNGDILLNLDTEDDDEYSIGCAGGIDTNISWDYKEEELKNKKLIKVEVKGLKGGHSGMDIHLGRGNANKILARMIHSCLDQNVQVTSFDGGSLRNAIPREGNVEIAVNSSNHEKVISQLEELANVVCQELNVSDPKVEISISDFEGEVMGMSSEDTSKLIQAIMATPNGVYRMSDNIPGLVETSSSLARVIVKEGNMSIQGLQRSSIESGKMEIAYSFAAPYHLIGASVEHDGSYPGWNPNPNSEILSIMVDLYAKRFNEEVKVKACHAGLECGILGEHFPKMDMISFGPTIKNPHSPDEKVNIKSVEKFWGLLKETLENIPNKN